MIIFHKRIELNLSLKTRDSRESIILHGRRRPIKEFIILTMEKRKQLLHPLSEFVTLTATFITDIFD